jgi:hypothetical protein
MLFPLYRKGSLFTNIVLNDYIKNSEYSYVKNINKTIENRNINKNRKNMLAGEKDGIEENSVIVIPSIFFLSLTTIIYYFYSKIC